MGSGKRRGNQRSSSVPEKKVLTTQRLVTKEQKIWQNSLQGLAKCQGNRDENSKAGEKNATA